MDEIRCNVDVSNQSKAPTRLIADYAVCETLGSGAFGTVYKVRKQTGQSFLAMKEVRVTRKLGQFHFVAVFLFFILPSVLRCCWLGGRKGIRPVKN